MLIYGIFLPTKVADFMQERMPILAISTNDGVLIDLYESSNVNYFAHNESVDSVMRHCVMHIGIFHLNSYEMVLFLLLIALSK